MKHYKDSYNNIFGFEEGYDVPNNLIEITMDEVNAINVIKQQEAFNALSYSEKRITEYPPIGDQLDALWKGGEAAAEMLAKVQAVKNKYPKSE